MPGIYIGNGIGKSRSPYWTPLSRNTDIVEAGGYLPVQDNGSSAVFNTTVAGRWFLNKNNLARIRQNGSIVKIQLYVRAINDTTDVYFQVWRINGTNYDLVGEENIKSRITIGSITEITLNTPIIVEEGDFIAIGGIGNGSTGITCYDTLTVNSVKYISGAKPATTNVNFDAAAADSSVLVVKVFMQAPMMVLIGDSIMTGYPVTDSFIYNTISYDKTESLTNKLFIKDSMYYPQGMGYHSNTTTQILARFTSDCINLKPKIALIEGGVNDIFFGVISKATFLSNWTAMLDACATSGIIPVACKIMPWTEGTNGQMQTRDDWCASLKTIVNSYAGSIWIDFDNDLGKFRAGGDAGNKWDIITEYNADDTHFTSDGYTKIVDVIDREIKKKYKFV